MKGKFEMFFQGEITTKKKVDLSGSKKKESRESVLAKAKKERERRLRQKLENESAIKIQVTVRSFYKKK